MPWWITLVAVSVYALLFYALELVFLGVLLDVSFGMQFAWVPFPCMYTVAAFLSIFLAERLKPYLRFTTRA